MEVCYPLHFLPDFLPTILVSFLKCSCPGVRQVPHLGHCVAGLDILSPSLKLEARLVPTFKIPIAHLNQKGSHHLKLPRLIRSRSPSIYIVASNQTFERPEQASTVSWSILPRNTSAFKSPATGTRLVILRHTAGDTLSSS